ncbi:hypothetical protein [Zunongwangia endophytica]|uniref:hypothetical protein n=1 Tax=Zunongwangia endophytica TaxID=1808945 RepID=UPI0025B5D0FC|nr:hypothetical protein [Zunongwangia endophytica]MDN3596958.1 hypothetical protein [Zunongwangia endophytica]
MPEVELKKGIIKANNLLNSSLVDSNFDFVYDNEYTIIFKEKPNTTQQQLLVSGTITDEQGMPLPGLTVYISSTQPNMEQGENGSKTMVRGTVTDFDGKFSIQADKGQFLVITV